VTRADRHRLLDMQEAVDDLSVIVERGRSAWEDDKFARLAAQKLLEILGEAAKQVGDDVRARFPDVPWRDLARVRDVYTHAYHRVDFDLMWEQLATQLPSLRQALGRIDPDGMQEG
jgi:uncharacterized protein with HEPN domain